MWYRSNTTKKLIHESSSKVVDYIFGEGVFEKLVSAGNLEPVDPPSVTDIIRETHSDVLALIRYREIFNCGFKEARQGIRILKKDMANNGYIPKKKYHKKPKKVEEPVEVPEIPEEVTPETDHVEN